MRRPTKLVESLSLDELLGRRLNDVEKKNAPRQIYAEGPMDIPLRPPLVSVVGTRRPTEEGAEEARSVAGMLADEGVAVVSGLAMGIDTVAHRTAIGTGGRTVAVLGTPLDRQHPKSNRDLQKEIAANHLAVSQFPVGRPVNKGNFVARNKTMALISNATVIVEAGDGGGTIHHGWESLRLGRPLFVCRTAAKARPRWLDGMVHYGAVMLDDYDDILYEIPQDSPVVTAFTQTPKHH